MHFQRFGSQKLFYSFLFLINLYSAGVLASTDQYQKMDRFESFNRAIFAFNIKADDNIAKPVAKFYRAITPNFVDKGITNFFKNIGDVGTFANSLFQAKFHNAIVTLNRIIYNTTFGLGGFIDVASSFGLDNNKEDFGQTLGYWGYENSTYLMLPFLGPSTVRDAGGLVVDIGLNPTVHIDNLHTDTKIVAQGIKMVDKRADLLGAESLIIDDKYTFLRNAFYQNRNYLIKDGKVVDTFSEDEADYEHF